jgi:hypothetical protein
MDTSKRTREDDELAEGPLWLTLVRMAQLSE